MSTFYYSSSNFECDLQSHIPYLRYIATPNETSPWGNVHLHKGGGGGGGGGGALGLFIRVTLWKLVSELGVQKAENMGVSHFSLLHKLGGMASLGPLFFKILYPPLPSLSSGIRRKPRGHIEKYGCRHTFGRLATFPKVRIVKNSRPLVPKAYTHTPIEILHTCSQSTPLPSSFHLSPSHTCGDNMAS